MQMLVKYEPEVVTEQSPSWTSFARQEIYNFVAKGLPIGTVKDDDNLLFIGENSPKIQIAAVTGKTYSILLLTSNPFYIMSDLAVMRTETFYTINADHKFLIKNLLAERLGGTASKINIMKWTEYPKPFEPSKHTNKLIGIMEPDFNQNGIFDTLYNTLNSFTSTALSYMREQGYPSNVDIAFYATNQETYERLVRRKATIPIYYLGDEDSPVANVATMPNAVVSIDAYRYNPVLSSWAQRIPVIRPNWVDNELAYYSSELNVPGKAALLSSKLISNIVNQIQAIENLEKSTNLADRLLRKSLLGDLYGDYYKG